MYSPVCQASVQDSQKAEALFVGMKGDGGELHTDSSALQESAITTDRMSWRCALSSSVSVLKYLLNSKQ